MNRPTQSSWAAKHGTESHPSSDPSKIAPMSSLATLSPCECVVYSSSCIDDCLVCSHAQDERQPTHVAPSIDSALSILSSTPIRNAFIIGGMSIYDQALKHPSTTRILLTRILHPEYDACDAFFPEIRNTGEWARAHHTDLESWLGFEVPSGVQQENQTEYEFQMWVRAIPSTIN